MVEQIEIEEFIGLMDSFPVIDVRSPGEYSQGHIPCAVNLPLFNDGERAIVGTIYKNSGREAAVLKGLELAGPKLAGFVKKAGQLVPRKRFLIHCWRGGMRSGQMAWLFDQAGFQPVLLAGGYKSYRRFIRESFSKAAEIIVIGGLTGSGKTDILNHLFMMGEQVLYLERSANHKGSVFGALGQEKQPTNEQFENDLHEQWRHFDFHQRIWIEDESRNIGNVIIPDPLFDRIISSPMIRIGLPVEARIYRIINEYAGFDPGLLKDSIMKISEKL